MIFNMRFITGFLTSHEGAAMVAPLMRRSF